MRLVIVMLLAGAAAASSPRRLAAEGGDGAAKTSALWGAAGEKWEPDGPFIDFSYAGEPLQGERLRFEDTEGGPRCVGAPSAVGWSLPLSLCRQP